MTIRVAINGYGRIGRMTLRAYYEQNKPHDIEIVAVNAPGQDEVARHLTRYDTVHGRFNAQVELSEDNQYLIVNGDRIRLLSERDPAKLPWEELGVDVVLECTGRFNSKESASAHLRAGAKRCCYRRLVARMWMQRLFTALMKGCSRPVIRWFPTHPAQPTVWPPWCCPCKKSWVSSMV